MSGSLPFLGVGLSYRWSLNAAIMKSPAGVDWLEVTPEHFLPFTEDTAQRLALLARRFPLVGHSLELSVGSDGADEPGYRDGIAKVLSASKGVWHGDHLCFTRVGDRPVRALTPVPFTDAAIEISTRNIRKAQRELGLPFVVENVAYYLQNPVSSMGEAEFLRKVAIEGDAGLLLDLHNVLTNATNHRFDPYRFLDALPLDRVVQIHIAGGEEIEGIRLDTHASCCPDEVWAMLEYVAPRCAVRGVNFEMDSRFPPWESIVAELERARTILRRCGLERVS